LQLPVFGTDKKLNSNQTLIKPPVYLALISDSHVYMNVFSQAHCVCVCVCVVVCVCVILCVLGHSLSPPPRPLLRDHGCRSSVSSPLFPCLEGGEIAAACFPQISPPFNVLPFLFSPFLPFPLPSLSASPPSYQPTPTWTRRASARPT